MPKIPVDYSKTIIYKIEHIDDDSLVYVGYTTNWNKRKCEHKHRYYNEKCSKHNYKVYKMIRENGGWEMFNMIEVEKYPCNDKREAERRETEVMKELKSNMNMMKSYLTLEDKNDYKIKANEKYYEGHKTIISEKGKSYRQNNKEVMRERKKRYYENNKEKFQGKQSMKSKCDCGCEITQYHLKRHQQSIKHIELMKKL